MLDLNNNTQKDFFIKLKVLAGLIASIDSCRKLRVPGNHINAQLGAANMYFKELHQKFPNIYCMQIIAKKLDYPIEKLESSEKKLILMNL